MGQYLDKEGLKAYHKIVEDLNKKNLKSIVLSENKLNVSSDDQVFSIGFDATSPLSVSKDDTNNSIIYSLDQTKVNAATVNGHTVGTDVPADALFTDTKYDDTTLQNKIANNEVIVMTLTSYPSGTLSLPAGVTVSDARGKMREGKAVVCYLNNDANVSIYYRFNSKVGNNYYFEAVSQYDIKSNRLTGVSMGCATVLEQNGSLVCKLDSLGLATSDSVADAAEKMVSITWSDLKDKRDAGTLTTGQQYRITDYTCTTTQAGTQSAGHQFDIIVTADSTSKLNEQARAILHDGDTYFASSHLEAWKVWYCLDNDQSRFTWADTENGKGVVYRLIDNWNNDCAYDFKNILFTIEEKTYTNTYYYESVETGSGTFVWRPTQDDISEEESPQDSIDTAPTAAGQYAWPDKSETRPAFTNVYTFNADMGSSNVDASVSKQLYNGLLVQGNVIDKYYGMSDMKRNIPVNVFCIYPVTDRSESKKLLIISNEIGYETDDNVFCHGAIGNKIKFGVSGNYINGLAYLNTISGQITNNTFSGYVYYNTFSGEVGNNIFSGSVENNTFSGYVYNNTFSGDTHYNTFSGSIENNTFSEYMWRNTCSGIVGNNVFSEKMENNIFSGEVQYNTFSRNVDNNTFSKYIHLNIFGNRLYDNTFSGNMWSNTFGGDVNNNTFSGSMLHNTFSGNIIFSQLEGSTQYCVYPGGDSDSTGLQYVRQTGELAGNSDAMIVITAATGVKYEQIITTNSNGQIIVYCEADLIMIPLTGVEVDGEDTLSATGTYTYKIKPTPANATDIKSIVWSSDANATYGSIDANTGVATIKQLPPVKATVTITATVTTNSGQTFTATKNVTINKAS